MAIDECDLPPLEAIDDCVSVDSPPLMTTGSVVCRYFLMGKCAYGNNCRFTHTLVEAGMEEMESVHF